MTDISNSALELLVFLAAYIVALCSCVGFGLAKQSKYYNQRTTYELAGRAVLCIAISIARYVP